MVLVTSGEGKHLARHTFALPSLLPGLVPRAGERPGHSEQGEAGQHSVPEVSHGGSLVKLCWVFLNIPVALASGKHAEQSSHWRSCLVTWKGLWSPPVARWFPGGSWWEGST